MIGWGSNSKAWLCLRGRNRLVWICLCFDVVVYEEKRNVDFCEEENKFALNYGLEVHLIKGKKILMSPILCPVCLSES